MDKTEDKDFSYRITVEVESMIKQEYKRYLISKGNIIFLAASIIPVVMSYYSTWLQKMDWITQYHNPDDDVSSAEDFLTIAKGYNCFTYLSDFLFSADFMIYFLWILLIGFTAVSGTMLVRHRRDGYGNMLVPRMGFRSYLKDMVIAQNLYILTVMSIYFFVLVGVTFVIFPPTENEYFVTTITFYNDTKVMPLLLQLAKQYLVIMVYVVLVMNITMLSGNVIRNCYIVQFLPVIIYLLPALIQSPIETFYYPLAEKLLIISPNIYLFSYYTLFVKEQSTLQAILSFVVLPAIFLIVILMLWKSCDKLERAYV